MGNRKLSKRQTQRIQSSQERQRKRAAQKIPAMIWMILRRWDLRRRAL